MIDKIKNHFKEVIKLKTSPLSIALGFSIGTFIAILPTPGISILICLVLVALFEKINKFAIFGSLIIWNPIILIPVYSYSYQLGNLAYKYIPYFNDIIIVNNVFNYSTRYLIGNVIFAVLISSLSYVIIWSLAKLSQSSKI